MEIWDAYYENGTKAGFDLIRDQDIKEGLYHIVCDILVRHVDGTYLLMQRDFNKKASPGKFEASAGGSVLKGESPVEGALRELEEETGLKAGSLKQIYHTIAKHSHCIYYGYLCIMNCNKNSIILQEGETISYKWISEKEFLEFINNDNNRDSKNERLKNNIHQII